MNPVIIVLVIVIATLLYFVALYNGLVRKKNAIDKAFASIDVMLRKRYDLVPQLVETVRGYMLHEKQVLLDLTELRRQVLSAGVSSNDKVDLDNRINKGLQSIFANVENYPDLKASQNFLNLQGAINETEEQLAAARRFYNAAVNEYHNAIEMFPSSLVASWMKLGHKNYFEIPESARAVPSTIIK
jgi:LemA protein